MIVFGLGVALIDTTWSSMIYLPSSYSIGIMCRFTMRFPINSLCVPFLLDMIKVGCPILLRPLWPPQLSWMPTANGLDNHEDHHLDFPEKWLWETRLDLSLLLEELSNSTISQDDSQETVKTREEALPNEGRSVPPKICSIVKLALSSSYNSITAGKKISHCFTQQRETLDTSHTFKSYYSFKI